MNQNREYIGFFGIYGIQSENAPKHLKSYKSDENIDFIPFSSTTDYYQTKNTFRTINDRRTQNILGLCNIVIDIDCHIENIDENQRQNDIDVLIYAINQDNDEYSHIKKTGRGIQVWYHLEPLSFQLLWLYSKTTDLLIKKYDDLLKNITKDMKIRSVFEVDKVASKNPAGLVRFDGINTKNKQKIEHIAGKQGEYDINMLFESLEHLTETSGQISRAIPSTLKRFEHDLLHARLKHLQTLKIEPGNRNTIYFLMYNTLVQLKDRKDAKDDLNRLNNVQKMPLRDLEYIFKYIDHKGHLKYKQKTFDEWTGENMTTKTTMRTENRNKTNLRNEKIKSLLSNKKITYKEIADTVSVSEKTIKRFATKLGMQRNNSKN